MSVKDSKAGPLRNWLGILDAMSESIAQTLHSVDQRHPGEADDDNGHVHPVDGDFCQRLDATIQGLAQRLDAARALAGRIDDMLDRDEREVRAWRATAEAARERLAGSSPL